MTTTTSTPGTCPATADDGDTVCVLTVDHAGPHDDGSTGDPVPTLPATPVDWPSF